MGVMLAEPGYHTRAFVEWEEHPRAALIAGQRAGYFAPAPIWTDLTTFDGRPFRGAIDTILAGYPCQPFSTAGQRKGSDDPRHLWPHVARVIREIEPRWVFLENVAGHISLGAETVLRELWDMGWTPAAGAFSAAETGAAHERLRWFCVAYRSQARCERTIGQHANIQPCERGTSLANADGGHPGAEREQRGGKLGLFAAGGGTGGGAVDDTAGARCFASRVGPDADRSGGQRLFGAGCDEMADASQPGSQGRERAGPPDKRDRATAFGSASERRRLPLFPPGPGDSAAWATIMAATPDRAPSFARRDLLAAAVNIAAFLPPGAVEELEPSLRSLARGAGMAEVVKEAPELVDQAAALTRLRNLADGLAQRTRALRLLGNGVFPLAAGYAWRTLSASHGLRPVDLETASTDDDASTGDGRSVRGYVT